MNFTPNWRFKVEKYLYAGNSSCLLILFFSCDFFDTAQYHISALNVKGESSCVATIVVKSR